MGGIRVEHWLVNAVANHFCRPLAQRAEEDDGQREGNPGGEHCTPDPIESQQQQRSECDDEHS